MEFEKFKEESEIPENMPGWENHSNSVDTYPSRCLIKPEKDFKDRTKQNSENYLPLWAMWLPVEFSKLNYTKDNWKRHFAAIGFKPVKKLRANCQTFALEKFCS